MDHKEVSRRGGLATSATHDKEFYRASARKANETIKQRYGEEYYKNLAKQGLEARKKKKEQIDVTVSSVTT